MTVLRCMSNRRVSLSLLFVCLYSKNVKSAEPMGCDDFTYSVINRSVTNLIRFFMVTTDDCKS